MVWQPCCNPSRNSSWRMKPGFASVRGQSTKITVPWLETIKNYNSGMDGVDVLIKKQPLIDWIESFLEVFCVANTIINSRVCRQILGKKDVYSVLTMIKAMEMFIWQMQDTGSLLLIKPQAFPKYGHYELTFRWLTGNWLTPVDTRFNKHV